MASGRQVPWPQGDANQVLGRTDFDVIHFSMKTIVLSSEYKFCYVYVLVLIVCYSALGDELTSKVCSWFCLGSRKLKDSSDSWPSCSCCFQLTQRPPWTRCVRKTCQVWIIFLRLFSPLILSFKNAGLYKPDHSLQLCR